MRECPYCKEEIKPDAIKCKHCLSSVTPEKPAHQGTCPYCKEEIKPEAIKCKHCKSCLLTNSPMMQFEDIPSFLKKKNKLGSQCFSEIRNPSFQGIGESQKSIGGRQSIMSSPLRFMKNDPYDIYDDVLDYCFHYPDRWPCQAVIWGYLFTTDIEYGEPYIIADLGCVEISMGIIRYVWGSRLFPEFGIKLIPPPAPGICYDIIKHGYHCRSVQERNVTVTITERNRLLPPDSQTPPERSMARCFHGDTYIEDYIDVDSLTTKWQPTEEELKFACISLSSGVYHFIQRRIYSQVTGPYTYTLIGPSDPQP